MKEKNIRGNSNGLGIRGYIYVMAVNGMYKVGFSNDPKRRRLDLINSAVPDIQIIEVYPVSNMAACEQKVHERLRADGYHHSGEVFTGDSKAICAAINETLIVIDEEYAVLSKQIQKRNALALERQHAEKVAACRREAQYQRDLEEEARQLSRNGGDHDNSGLIALAAAAGYVLDGGTRLGALMGAAIGKFLADSRANNHDRARIAEIERQLGRRIDTAPRSGAIPTEEARVATQIRNWFRQKNTLAVEKRRNKRLEVAASLKNKTNAKKRLSSARDAFISEPAAVDRAAEISRKAEILFKEKVRRWDAKNK